MPDDCLLIISTGIRQLISIFSGVASTLTARASKASHFSSSVHCSVLAVEGLRSAIQNYEERHCLIKEKYTVKD